MESIVRARVGCVNLRSWCDGVEFVLRGKSVNVIVRNSAQPSCSVPYNYLAVYSTPTPMPMPTAQ